MSDIIIIRPTRRGQLTRRSRPTANAAERVLEWIERRLRKGRLGPGDSLPGEIEIAAATRAGRSSVREALTAMKVLGIIRSRRKGGITIIRDPVLLELRHYFGERYHSPALLDDALEFRAAMEWGFGPLALARVKPSTIQTLRRIIREAVAKATSWRDLNPAEARFHTILLVGCGNHLAGLFAHLYAPIFRGIPATEDHRPLSPQGRDQWGNAHLALVEAIEVRDEQAFLRLLQAHTHGYMRWKNGKPTRKSI